MNRDQPLKVAHIITRLIIGGAQENTLLSVVGLQETGSYDVWLITGPTRGPEGSLMAEEANGSFRVKLVPTLRRNIQPFFDLVALVHLWWIIRREKFTIVHTHSSKAGILGRLAAHWNRVPVVVHTIHGLPFFPGQRAWLNWIFIRMERWAAPWTTRIACVAPAMATLALEAGIGTREQFLTIYSGMDLSVFRNDAGQRDAIRRRHAIAPDALVIGKIARLFHFKGHEFLLQAVARLKSQFPRIVVLLVGDGILRRELETQARTLGLFENIRFAGLVPPAEIPWYVQAFDVLAHVSLREGLPRAVVQAAAAGVPAVCFAIDGAKDIIHNGVDGFLVPAGDVGNLCERLSELLCDKGLRQRMGAAARTKVQEMFSRERMVRQLDELYQHLTNARSQR